MPYGPLFAKLAAVADLTQSDVHSLVRLSERERIVRSKADILPEGERPEHVHLILEGWAARYKTLGNGSRQIVAMLIPGDFCDLQVSILGHMDHGIAALTPCRIACIPRGRLDALISSQTELMKAFWWATLFDESVSRAWILNIGRRSAYERVAHLLCELHARLALVGLVGKNGLALPLTQEQLAEASGLTTVHVNRTLKRLRDENLIHIRNRMIEVIDIGLLCEAAGFNGDYLQIKRGVETAH